MVEMTLKQAIDSTIIYELRTNRNSVLISNDIGNIFQDYREGKGTDVKISEDRLIEIPDSENANFGAAVGLCLNGFNVIIEVDGTKNLLRCLDPLVNYITKLNDSEKEEMGSLLIKCPIGYKAYSSSQNSECIESVIATFPGIDILYPSSPMDAIGLIRSSFTAKNPVVLFEDRNLFDKKGIVEDAKAENEIAFGSAKVIREGGNVTVVSYGSMIREALKAADVATMSDVSVEIIDLRTVKPLDMSTIIKSVKKTGKLIILQEGYNFASIGSEIVSQIVESDAFDYLEAPIIRLGNNDVLPPYNPKKAKEVLPSSGKLLEKIIEIVKY